MSTIDNPVPDEPAPGMTFRKLTGRDGMIQASLSILITFGFFGVITALMTLEMQQGGHEVLLVLVGALGASFGAVVNYYFGSSSGSAAKTAMGK